MAGNGTRKQFPDFASQSFGKEFLREFAGNGTVNSWKCFPNFPVLWGLSGIVGNGTNPVLTAGIGGKCREFWCWNCIASLWMGFRVEKGTRPAEFQAGKTLGKAQ